MAEQWQFEAVNAALTTWGQKITDAIGAALPHTKDVDGSLRNSIRFTISSLGFPIVFQITMADYWRFVDEGRKPGSKFPPPDVIRQWIINKGLAYNSTGKIQSLHGSMPKKGLKANITKGQTLLSNHEMQLRTLTYLFSRKIARDGIAPTPFVTDTLTVDSVAELQANLSAAFKQDVNVAVVKITNQYRK